MARSFSNAKLLSAQISNAISRRGYASVAPGLAIRGEAAAASLTRDVNLDKKSADDKNVFKVSWVPNPKTGVYGPENHADDIDVAELRNALSKKH